MSAWTENVVRVEQDGGRQFSLQPANGDPVHLELRNAHEAEKLRQFIEDAGRSV